MNKFVAQILSHILQMLIILKVLCAFLKIRISEWNGKWNKCAVNGIKSDLIHRNEFCHRNESKWANRNKMSTSSTGWVT